MKKITFIILCFVCLITFNLQADRTSEIGSDKFILSKTFAATSELPKPVLKFDCDEMNNSHELVPEIGSIHAMVTDLTGEAVYKDDAMVITDAERGKVFYLPNVSTGDQNENHRALRITSDESLVGTGDFTITFWTKVRFGDSNSLNGFPPLLVFDGTLIELRTLAWWNASKPSLKIANNVYLNSIFNAADYIFDWVPYAIVKEGSTVKFYINNVLQATLSNQNINNADLKKLRLNSQAYGYGSFFDDIQIFHEALTEEILKQISLTAQAFPKNGGSVHAGFSLGTATLMAVPNDGYIFSHWSLNGKSVSTEATWVFEPSADAPLGNYVANFKELNVNDPALDVLGENYTILPLSTTENLFSNRTVKLMSILEDFNGWKFIQNSAKASYNPGKEAKYSIRPEKTGYVYAMVANLEDVDIVESWANANAWEQVPSYTLAYGSRRTEQVYFYRKIFEAETWTNVVFPEVFSRAIIIAPDVQATNPLTDATEVTVSSVSNINEVPIYNGISAYVNESGILFNSVLPDIKGLNITYYNKNESDVSQTVKAEEAGVLYIGIANSENIFDLTVWELVNANGFAYDGETFAIYKKTVAKDEELELISSTKFGIHIIGTKINVELIRLPVTDAIGLSVAIATVMDDVLLENDISAYNDIATVTISSVIPEIEGLRITRYKKDEANISLKVKANESGMLYVAVAGNEGEFDVGSWELFNVNGFSYDNESFAIYKKAVTKDQEIELNSSTDFGIHVLGTKIDLIPGPGTGILVQNTAEIKSVIIYTLDGCPLKQCEEDLPSGVYVKKVLYENGDSETFKFMKTNN